VDFEPFRRTASTGALGTNLKNALYQQAFINIRKHAEFWVRALDGSHKDVEIHMLEVLVQNPTNWLAEKGFSALVINWLISRQERGVVFLVGH